MIGKILLSVMFAVMLITWTSTANAAILTPKDNEAKKDILGIMSDKVDHKWDKYSVILGKVKGDNTTFVIINRTGDSPIPPIVCGDGTHEENGACIPDIEVPPEDNQTTPPDDNETDPVPEPEPEPEPTNNVTIVNFAGDFSGFSVINAMLASNSNYNVALGDLLYKSSLDSFIDVWPKDEGRNKCVPGNHDQEEDGNANIAEQSSEYCGDIWVDKIASGTTVLIGFNSNGNIDTELGTAQEAIMNEEYMAGVKNVVIASHKPCNINDDSHHKVEGNVEEFCNNVEAKVPEGVNVFTISGHEHNSAENDNGKWFIAGGGGKGKYNCGSTAGGWSFCNDNDNGYLQMTITNGDIETKFIKTNGDEMQ